MAVYVDNPIFPFRGKMYCHMATDRDIEELHRFANRLGMKFSWFQNHPQHPHYDLSPNKRELAIRLGAIEISTLELIHICYKRDKSYA